MKILSVISSVDPKFGGPSEAIKNIARESVSRGHEYHVVTCDAPGQAFLDAFPKIFAVGPSLRPFAYTKALPQWLSANIKNYDAVIVHGLWQYTGVAVWKTATKAKVPYWVIPHGMLDPYFNKLSRLKTLRKQLYWILQHPVLENANALLFTAEEERRLARESFKPYRVKERVISYAAARPPKNTEEEIKAFFNHFPIVQGKKYLLFLGRIHPKKGADMLIKAFAANPTTRENYLLVMAGPDQEGTRAKLEAVAAESGVGEKIVWTGMLQGQEKYGAFKAADAFVLPSHQENFGIAVAEALACGLPTLIAKPVNIWREIESYKAGLVEPDTDEGTAALLDRWNKLSEGEKKTMRSQALKCYEERFTVEACVTDLLKAISEK